MDYNKFLIKVRDSRTSSQWIDRQIIEQNDIRALRILAASKKASSDVLEALYDDFGYDYEINLALSKNISSSTSLLKWILYFVAEMMKKQEWSKEDCQKILEALRKNPKTPKDAFDEVEYQILKEKWEEEERIIISPKDEFDEDESDDELTEDNGKDEFYAEFRKLIYEEEEEW